MNFNINFITYYVILSSTLHRIQTIRTISWPAVEIWNNVRFYASYILTVWNVSYFSACQFFISILNGLFVCILIAIKVYPFHRSHVYTFIWCVRSLVFSRCFVKCLRFRIEHKLFIFKLMSARSTIFSGVEEQRMFRGDDKPQRRRNISHLNTTPNFFNDDTI